MITLKQLKFGNIFSYGPDNVIDFTGEAVTQLVGLNGHGKTSIPLILQEVLYAKNGKKIVKASLKNRYVDGSIWADLTFSVEDTNYLIKMTRGSKLIVNLFKDGEDISSHTAPETIKTIENILNLDFDTFSQLVYQSTKNSLQFLTATDTQRKKFLISLFNLEKYISIFEELKGVLTEINKEIANVQGKFTVYEDWLNSNKNADLTPKEFIIGIALNEDNITRLETCINTKAQLQSINKKINANNEYISERESIDISLVTKALHEPKGIADLEKLKISTSTLLSEELKNLKNADGKKPFCPVFKQSIDISDSEKMAVNCREKIEKFNEILNDTTTQLQKLKTLQAEDTAVKKAANEFEKLSSLIDTTIAKEIVDIKELDEEIAILREKIATEKALIEKVNAENRQIAAHNASVKVKKEQLVEYTDKLDIELNNLERLWDKSASIEILKEAFSTNGLVSYKLEFLVKDLEIVINEYLEELSRGRFQLNFILKGDKLNIEISDDGLIITINEVSEGELAKINVSTLLAIRKLMQQLSNTKLNLLFLDEIMGVLDSHGREDLINVLLAEDSLNTFLVTHEYRHPLVPVLNIIKENKISRIEDE